MENLTNEEYKIFYQGAPGAFSHKAAQIFSKELFAEKACNYVALETFSQVFSAVDTTKWSLACLPFDNSIIGAITENYTYLLEHEFVILAELFLPINHKLLALPGAKLSQIKQVFSHPAAIGQCQNFLRNNSNFEICSYYDTAGAAQYVKETNDLQLAAIASELAAKIYGLDILVENVEDNQDNITRFLLLAQTNVRLRKNFPMPLTESICLPGKYAWQFLSDILVYINEDFSILDISTRPARDLPWQHHVLIDFIVNSGEINRLSKLKLESNKTYEYKYLGTYPRLSNT